MKAVKRSKHYAADVDLDDLRRRALEFRARARDPVDVEAYEADQEQETLQTAPVEPIEQLQATPGLSRREAVRERKRRLRAQTWRAEAEHLAEYRLRGHLTWREMDVARLIALGHTRLEMARILGMSKQTIDWHHRRIMVKIGLETSAALTILAIREGILTIEGLITIDTSAQLVQSDVTMAKQSDFKSHVNKHTSRAINALKLLSKVGPQCADPAELGKVRDAVNKALAEVEHHWKNKTAPASSGFAL